MRKESGHQTPQTETEESSEIWGRSRQLKERVIKWIDRILEEREEHGEDMGEGELLNE